MSIEQAIRDYANHEPLDLKSAHEIQSDLLAIAGEKHIHKAGINSDACAICGRDIRNEVHYRDRQFP